MNKAGLGRGLPPRPSQARKQQQREAAPLLANVRVD